jgi:hypothetical protein
MSKQNYVYLMTQHRLDGISSVDNTKSSHLPNSMTTKFLDQHVLILAHVDVSMNLSRRWQISNNLKYIQIIKMWALKQKKKCHFMKWNDNVLKCGKH